MSPEGSQGSSSGSRGDDGEASHAASSSGQDSSGNVEFSNFSYKNLEALTSRNREAAAEMAALRAAASAPGAQRLLCSCSSLALC